MRISYDAYDLPVEVTSGNEVWTMEYTPMGNLRRQTRRTSSMRMVSALNYEYDSYDQLKLSRTNMVNATSLNVTLMVR